MRLVFAGTPEFAERALSALIEAGHDIALVLTQPDRPSGRGLRDAQSAVKRRAIEAGIPVYQPASLREPDVRSQVCATRAEMLVVAAYGLILPRALLDAAARGAVNIHASLLPRWRGAAPIQRALLAGDAQTGITLMQMDEGLDTGPILLQRAIPVLPADDAGTLHARLAALGAQMMVEFLGSTPPSPVAQPAHGACHAAKITAADARIDWQQPAIEIERVVRAMRPAPGAQTLLRAERLKVWRGDCVPGSGPAGTVLAVDTDGIAVACGSGALMLRELQRAGGRRMSCAEFLRGARIAPGERLGA